MPLFGNFNQSFYQQAAQQAYLSDKQLAELIEKLKIDKIGQAPAFGSLSEINAALDKLKASKPKPKIVDKAARIQEIETELDIIRGRVPTPKGYTIDPDKVKTLVKELKELRP